MSSNDKKYLRASGYWKYILSLANLSISSIKLVANSQRGIASPGWRALNTTNIKLEIAALILILSHYIGRFWNWLWTEWRPYLIRLIFLLAIPIFLLLIFNNNEYSWIVSANTSNISSRAISNTSNLSLEVISNNTSNISSGIIAKNIIIGIIKDAKSHHDISFLNIFGIWLIIWIIIEMFFVFRHSIINKVIVEDFKPTAEIRKTELNDFDVSRRLSSKLQELNRIYSKANEMRSISTATGVDQPMQASLKVEDVETLFENVISPIGMGKYLDQIVFILERIFSRAKIIVKISKDEESNGIGKLTLIAHMTGNDIFDRTWEVTRRLPLKKESSQGSSPNGSTEETIEDMVEELAARIFTDYIYNQSGRELINWKATLEFSKGLKAYRDSLRSDINKKLSLVEAEEKFLETLAIDQEFNRVYYNLGLVYTELKHDEAADLAFRKATKSSPDHWEAYYALGLSQFQKASPKEVDMDFMYVFSWNEIPGKDNEILLKFLMQKFGIEWVKAAKIEKIDSGKTIKVSTGKNSLSLKLSDKKTEVILEIDDGKTNTFIAKLCCVG